MTAVTSLLAPNYHERMHDRRSDTFYGWRVVGAAFILAVFGLGIGFHGPAVYLHAIHENRGWPLALISTAVTAHFLVGAVVVANLPALYRRFGIPTVTKAGAILLAAGVFGWAIAAAPWQLFMATLLSGAGWVTMGVAAINAIVAPWFVRGRPAALAMAYNGGNIGGVVFSPLWAAAIGAIGFAAAAAGIGLVMAITMWVLADLVFSRTPQQMRLIPDGDAPGAPDAPVTASAAMPLPGSLLWRDRKFLTLAAGMALGLFAQIGLTVHLFSLLVPALGATRAGLAMGLVTAMAIMGRALLGWAMPAEIDRRLMACASYAVQIAGCVGFIAAEGASVPLLLLGVVLFGAGFGNGTWLPPLIAQVEFAGDDVPRVVALIVAISQATYAFAPVVFGMIREFTPGTAGTDSGAAPALFVVAGIVQGLAISAFLAGRRRALRVDNGLPPR
jgi:Major Facilitator Superfamily